MDRISCTHYFLFFYYFLTSQLYKLQFQTAWIHCSNVFPVWKADMESKQHFKYGHIFELIYNYSEHHWQKIRSFVCVQHVMVIVFTQTVPFVFLPSWHSITTTLFKPQREKKEKCWQEANSFKAPSQTFCSRVPESSHLQMFSTLHKHCGTSTGKCVHPADSSQGPLTSYSRLSHKSQQKRSAQIGLAGRDRERY